MFLKSNKYVFLLLISLLPGVALAAVAYKEKIHYEAVIPPQPTSVEEGKIEVVEMFWYGCPHCNKLEPYVERWLKKIPKEAVFVRMPAIFRPGWEIGARAFYTAEILGVVDKIHPAMFEAIHRQKRKMDSEAKLMEFFKQHGVSNKDFNRAYRSFAVEAKIRRSKDMSQRYGIKGVPAIIVNGKYRTSGHLAGSNANLFKVVNYLVDKEAKLVDKEAKGK